MDQEFTQNIAKDSKTSVLRVRCQVCNYAQMQKQTAVLETLFKELLKRLADLTF